MAETPTINRNNTLPPHEDYDFLRKQAIRYIERLAGKTWTDYNTHDPGITLLEAVCYCLTDLGYRTSFNIKDLLAPKIPSKNYWKNTFYTAGQVLHTNPVTLLDFRKMVIDTDGVRNAWIEMSDDYETLLYLQARPDPGNAALQNFNLTYDPTHGAQMLHLRGLYKVFLEYESYVASESREEEVAEVVRQKLNAHRNLCEDFVSVSSIEYELFQIEAELQVNEGTDIEKVQAQVYHVIHNFLSPPVTFYTLRQMLDKGYAAEEIFDGPALKYGFIETSELEKSERFKSFHLSDIMSLISDIEGVIAIKKFAMPIESQSPMADFTDWIDKAKDRQKAPKLDVENSVVRFVRSGDRHRSEPAKRPNPQRVNAIFLFLQSSAVQSKLKSSKNDFDIPEGEYMQLEEYFPMQQTLPAAYGMEDTFIDNKINEDLIREVIAQVNDGRKVEVGDGTKPPLFLPRLPAKSNMIAAAAWYVLKDNLIGMSGKEKFIDDHVDSIAAAYRRVQVGMLDKRKKLALQLRGFLMVFEQLMSDYLSQLANINELFSYNHQSRQSFFPAPVQGIKDIESLFIDYDKYRASLLQITETESEFRSRRNQMLDHLLSRFAESMSKYAHYMKETYKTVSEERLITDKINLLSDYIQVSNYRAKGFDYANGGNADNDAWGNTNVEGFKKRVCRLLGIPDYRREIIASDAIYIAKTVIDENITRYFVVLADPDDRERILLKSKEYEFESEAHEILRYILENGARPDVYQRSGKKNEWAYSIIKRSAEADDEEIAAMEFSEKDSQVAKQNFEAAYDRTIEVLNHFSSAENFHLIEHILLRPKIGERQTGRKQGAQINADVIDLLPVNGVEAKSIILKSVEREIPYQFNISEIKNQKKADKVKWKLSLSKPGDVNDILVVNEEFSFYKHLTRRIEYIRKFGSDRVNYAVSQTADGYHTFSIVENARQLAASKRNFKLLEDMEAAIMQLIEYFSFEGETSNEEDEEAVAIASLADPYSFQVTIVLPSWPERFRDPTFKHLLEKAIYLELPAHIHAYVYWLGHTQMKEFEEAYKLWIEELPRNDIPDTEIVNNMISVLKQLN